MPRGTSLQQGGVFAIRWYLDTIVYPLFKSIKSSIKEVFKGLQTDLMQTLILCTCFYKIDLLHDVFSTVEMNGSCTGCQVLCR